MIDHSMLSESWIPNKVSAIFTYFVLVPWLHIKYSETPIRIKSVIQTGENIQFGGLKVGFSKAAYHVEIEGKVKNEPITPANWQITIEDTSLVIFLISIIY